MITKAEGLIYWTFLILMWKEITILIMMMVINKFLAISRLMGSFFWTVRMQILVIIDKVESDYFDVTYVNK